LVSFDSKRWDGIKRSYSLEDVKSIQGAVKIDYTLAKKGANKLWNLLNSEKYVRALGALTGGQAVQMVQAGLKAIYLSGWQVAADANLARETYPDQSLYPANSAPALVERINNAFERMDQKYKNDTWYAPIIADAEAGFGGSINSYELMKSFIKSGASGVHFEDQLASEKKCGHLGGKVLIPTRQFVNNLTAARLAADVMGVETILIARTDANAANLLTSDIDERDYSFITGERTDEGFFRVKPGLDQAISRGLSYAPFADLIWCETSKPDLGEAKEFADAIHDKFPEKMLAYNCSPSFNWKSKLDDNTIARFQDELGEMNYKFQFITLAGFHSLNHGMFELAKEYNENGMPAYVKLQQSEFASERDGYSATKHQKFVGTDYFDKVREILSAGKSSTSAMVGSTENEQFEENVVPIAKK
jgi:isocitrate lyase